MEQKQKLIGIIGVGIISSALVKGLCISKEPPRKIILSQRSTSKTEQLQKEFPQIITIEDNNQKIVDQCDIIIISVLTTQVDDVLKGLKFRSGQTLLSLVSSSTVVHLQQIVGNEVTVCKAVPLPAIQFLQGVTPIQVNYVKKKQIHFIVINFTYPPNSDTSKIFNLLGKAIEVKTEDQYLKLNTICCQMGPFYQFLQNQYKWLVNQGVDTQTASQYVGQLFHSISKESAEQLGGFQDLIDGQTPGGLNEQSINVYNESGFEDMSFKALDNAYERLTHK